MNQTKIKSKGIRKIERNESDNIIFTCDCADTRKFDDVDEFFEMLKIDNFCGWCKCDVTSKMIRTARSFFGNNISAYGEIDLTDK